MKIDAGEWLKNQNPIAEPAQQAPRHATKYCSLTIAAVVKNRNAMDAVPTARPSMLSKKLVALKMKMIQNTVRNQLRNGRSMKRVM